MMGDVRFAKGHGTGNDFVILPDPDDRRPLTPAVVAALCDRRRGVGGDGVLRVVRRDGGWFMDYWNADGSLAEMCGNGARVYARYLVAAGLADPGRIRIGTRAGTVTAMVTDDAVSVDMGGRPRPYGEGAATVTGATYRGTAVDCGNPHLVCPVDGAALNDMDLSRPPRVDPDLFPHGANVEFVAPVSEGHVRMRVHERGVGETLSCGTGACAAAAVALRDAGRPTGAVTVDVPGGRLTVTLDKDTCWLTGPAVIVATGAVDLAGLTNLDPV
jgi:diaminopimelate epimerase